MKIGMVGLGKLGLPCVLAMEDKGHEVVGYDPSSAVLGYVTTHKVPYQEPGTNELLQKTTLRVVSIPEVVEHSEIVFVAVQTPHHPKYEGITRVPEERVDFDYSYLKTACGEISKAVEALGVPKIVVVISTVMPGTIEREIKPFLSPLVKLCYNPYFIAMGTTIQDFYNPEFVLFGVDDKEAADKAEEFYKTVHSKPFFRTTVKNAEAIKVLYNTAITAKIELANTIMELSHKTGVDCDAVVDALSLATDRVVSTKYMRGGMGDSGGCHPRDLIALSWLERNLDMKARWFDKLIEVREKQTEFMADLVEYHREVPVYSAEDFSPSGRKILPVVILGTAYKPGINLTIGSSALLLKELLQEKGIQSQTYDPWVDTFEDHLAYEALRASFEGGWSSKATPRLFFIGINHPEFKDYKFPRGSVVIDPFRMIPDREFIRVVRIGEAKPSLEPGQIARLPSP